MTPQQFLMVAYALLDSMRGYGARNGPAGPARMGLKRPKSPISGTKRLNVASEIGGITWIPDENRIETAKRLVSEGYFGIEEMKDYLMGDWN